MVRLLHSLLVSFCVALSLCGSQTAKGKDADVFLIDMRAPVDRASWHMLSRGLEVAKQRGARLVILSINTYGGQLDIADSMRSALLNYNAPVWAFIDNEAASAGALIALACDSIYMRQGASMGAATVVSGADGMPVPDKYQSFMRSMMRSTAQAAGKRAVRTEGGRDSLVYRRNPSIAEAMVDPALSVPGVVDSGKVLTFSTEEAIANGYCEGQFGSVEEILAHYDMAGSHLERFEPTGVDRVKSFFLSPIVSGILIMLVVGGLYFELQTPGVGFPLVVALGAAAAFFIPLYIDGLVQNLDLVVFLVGVLLLLIEIFVIPGFGVVGILGLIAIVAGLSLALVDNAVVFEWRPESGAMLLRAVAVVVGALTLSVFGCVALGGALIKSPRIPALALRSELSLEKGYVGVAVHDGTLAGRVGVADTVLRPSGKVVLDGKTYDAISLQGLIEQGCEVIVERVEANQVYVRRKAV